MENNKKNLTEVRSAGSNEFLVHVLSYKYSTFIIRGKENGHLVQCKKKK